MPVSVSWIVVSGVLVEGHRVASGPSREYPYGALEKQKPLFYALGLNLSDMYNGTLNVSINPKTFALTNPEFTLENVEWTDLHPPETFSFSKCVVKVRGNEYYGWVYYPHPETKIRHYQNTSVIEILAPFIAGIEYGDEVEIRLNGAEISIGTADSCN